MNTDNNNAEKNNTSRLTWLAMLILLVVATVVVAAYVVPQFGHYLMVTRPATQERTKAEERSSVTAQIKKSGIATSLIDAKFPQDFARVTNRINGNSNEKLVSKYLTGDALRITGKLQLFTVDAIAVDTEKSYEIKLAIKIPAGLEKPESAIRLFAGFVSFDADNTLIEKNGKRIFRYPVTRGNLPTPKNLSDRLHNGWYVFSAIISGESDKGVATFVPKTKYVRLMLNIQIQQAEAYLELGQLSLTAFE